MTFNELPLYYAYIDDRDCGIQKVSLVTDPATEVNFIYFDKDKPYTKFAKIDDLEHKIQGVIMVADTPIYRRDADGYEYYVAFSKQILCDMSERMLLDHNTSKVNIEHTEGTDVEGVNLVEIFQIDREKGIDPKAFADVPDGSLLGTYKVHNDEVWNKIENGEILSFSLEGIFNFKFDKVYKEDKEIDDLISFIDRMSDKIKRIKNIQ